MFIVVFVADNARRQNDTARRMCTKFSERESVDDRILLLFQFWNTKQYHISIPFQAKHDWGMWVHDCSGETSFIMILRSLGEALWSTNNECRLAANRFIFDLVVWFRYAKHSNIFFIKYIRSIFQQMMNMLCQIEKHVWVRRARDLLK